MSNNVTAEYMTRANYSNHLEQQQQQQQQNSSLVGGQEDASKLFDLINQLNSAAPDTSNIKQQQQPVNFFEFYF